MKRWILNLILILMIAAAGVMLVFQSSQGLAMQKTLKQSLQDRKALEQSVVGLEDEISEKQAQSDRLQQEIEELVTRQQQLEESASKLTADMEELEATDESLSQEIEGYEKAWEEAKERAVQ